MKLRRVLAVAAMLVMVALPVHAGDVEQIVIYAGNTDSNEVASRWFKVEGARRVVIRLWSEHAAFSATNADTLFSDSITTFRVLFSDSIAAPNWNIAVDSLVANPAVATPAFGDTVVMISARPLPINRPLRAPANGSGWITIISPTLPGNASPWNGDPGGFFAKKYMRIRVTPLRRLVSVASEQDAPRSVNGLKGFKMVASIYREE